MSKTNLAIVGIILLAVSLACKTLMPGKTSETPSGPTVDFTTPGKSLDVKVQLDKKHSAREKISPAGGTVSLTSADGSKFTLDVPANALDTETEITMTALKSIEGAPLDKNSATAVQLEPSGQFFKEMLTLTIVPAKEIPIKNQIIFGYEEDGKDYHLAPVDPKSKDIKIKLMRFSGAGVGSGGDVAWAANLQIQAESMKTRLQQKIGELLQTERLYELGWGEREGPDDSVARLKSLFDQYDDQVIRKVSVAAELDCRYARGAIEDILELERNRQLLGTKPDMNLHETVAKFVKIGEECKKAAAFQIVGGLDDWQTSTKVCDIMQPFELTAGGFLMKLSGGLSGTYSYSGPYAGSGTGTYTISLPGGLDKPGTMTGTGDGSAGGASAGGSEKYTLTPIEPCKK